VTESVVLNRSFYPNTLPTSSPIKQLKRMAINNAAQLDPPINATPSRVGQWNFKNPPRLW
jgi:hypothetical protein